MSNKPKMSQKQILAITCIWIGVAVISVLAFLFFGGQGNTTTSADKLNVNILTDDYNRIEANYVMEDVPADITADGILEMTGTSPFLSYLPEGYEMQGTALYVPHDESGSELRDDTVFGVLYTNPNSEAYYILIKVSKGPLMRITESKAVFNLSLGDDSQAWSSIGGHKVKVFKQDNDGEYAALFQKDSHFWRVDFNNVSEENIVNVIRQLV